MANSDTVDCSPALPLSLTNHVEPSDESLLVPVNPVPSMEDRAQKTSIFRCQWLGCRSHASFRREVDLIRHLKTIHIAPDAYSCPEPNCGAAFGRKDHLKAHLKTHQKPNQKNRHSRRK